MVIYILFKIVILVLIYRIGYMNGQVMVLRKWRDALELGVANLREEMIGR